MGVYMFANLSEFPTLFLFVYSSSSLFFFAFFFIHQKMNCVNSHLIVDYCYCFIAGSLVCLYCAFGISYTRFYVFIFVGVLCMEKDASAFSDSGFFFKFSKQNKIFKRNFKMIFFW